MWIEDYFSVPKHREWLFKIAWISSWGMLVLGCMFIALMWGD